MDHNTDHTSHPYQDDRVEPLLQEDSKLFNWWPPGFLGEGEMEAPDCMEPCAESVEEPEQDREEPEELLGQKLSQSYRIIDSQAKQIHEMTEEITQLEEEKNSIRQQAGRIKKRYQIATQCVLGGISLVTILTFHREVSQVGWNLFRWITDMLCITPENAVGFLTSLAAALLLWQTAKWTYRAALEDIFGEKEGESDDLGDW